MSRWPITYLVGAVLALPCVIGCAAGGSADPRADASDTAEALVVPKVGDTQQLCKLLSNRNSADPTANDVQHRANIAGADLGIPVAADDKMFIMFGDTIGVRGIWPPSESHPDSVGYGLDSATAIGADPSLLCSRMRMVTLPASHQPPPIGPSLDSTIESDFAAVAMAPPSGRSLTEFIRNPAGNRTGTNFMHLPGDFEVPSGAFAVGSSIYVFYTTVVSSMVQEMKGSYLAKWVAPQTTGPFGYQILYQVDQRFDSSGPLNGRFINVAAQVSDDYLYIFGTGQYRKSTIHVARKPLAMLDTPGGFEERGEIVNVPGHGELSVQYFASHKLWMLLAQESLPGQNRIVARFSKKPEGPWSDAVVIQDMADPTFRSKYCCAVEDQCEGSQFLNCDRAGFYGSYLFPATIDASGSFKVTFTVSSFTPYNVALFQTTFTNTTEPKPRR